MESSDICFSRAQADRDAASEKNLPREREVLERSAQQWEDMAKRALSIEGHRVAEDERRAELAGAKVSETTALEEIMKPAPKPRKKPAAKAVEPITDVAAPVPAPPPPLPQTRSYRERLRWFKNLVSA